MNPHRQTNRCTRQLRSTVAVLVAVLGIFGAQSAASAAQSGSGAGISKDQAKAECEMFGGEFVDLGEDGFLCRADDIGLVAVCDNGGVNCQVCWQVEGGTACADRPDWRPTPTSSRPVSPDGATAPDSSSAGGSGPVAGKPRTGVVASTSSPGPALPARK